MTHPSEIHELLRTIRKLQRQVSRQNDFVSWVKLHARHALFCPARKQADGAECVCGLNRLDNRFK